MKRLAIDKKSLRTLQPSDNPFRSLASSIISQQVSIAAAASMLKKFTALWPRKAFPLPRDVLSIPLERLHAAGLSKRKAAYIKDLAEKFLDGTISPNDFPRMSDEAIIEHLVRVKGIGVWTAHMFLIFALARPNVLPVGDLAIRRGFQKAFNLTAEPSEQRMRALASAHAGEHTALALHLWNLMDAERKQKQAKRTKLQKTSSRVE